MGKRARHSQYLSQENSGQQNKVIQNVIDASVGTRVDDLDFIDITSLVTDRLGISPSKEFDGRTNPILDEFIRDYWDFDSLSSTVDQSGSGADAFASGPVNSPDLSQVPLLVAAFGLGALAAKSEFVRTSIEIDSEHGSLFGERGSLDPFSGFVEFAPLAQGRPSTNNPKRGDPAESVIRDALRGEVGRSDSSSAPDPDVEFLPNLSSTASSSGGYDSNATVNQLSFADGISVGAESNTLAVTPQLNVPINDGGPPLVPPPPWPPFPPIPGGDDAGGAGSPQDAGGDDGKPTDPNKPTPEEKREHSRAAETSDAIAELTGTAAAAGLEFAASVAGFIQLSGGVGAGIPIVSQAGAAAAVVGGASLVSHFIARTLADYHRGKATDPIYIDIDDDGLDLVSLSNGSTAAFDIDSDGFKERTAWSSTDALLVRDLNQNGLIDDGSEVSFNEVAEGITDLDKLADYDGNSDGVIDQSDAIFGELFFWVDADQNGFTDSGELTSLSDADVVSIGLTPTAVDPQSPDVVYWDDSNNNGLIEEGEIYETAASAPAGSIAAQELDGGYLFQTATITTTTGTLTAYTVGLDYDPSGSTTQFESDGTSATIAFEDGRSELWKLLSDPAGETFDLTNTTYSGAIGGEGADTLTNTGPKSVSLLGGDGNDTLTGAAGDDLLAGGDGADGIDAGEGDDLIFFDAADLTPGISGGGGFDIAIAATSDAVNVNLGTTELEVIFGNDGNDTFTAGSAVDVILVGGAGNDALTGGSGDDVLVGGEGLDSLSGGAGDDTLRVDSNDTNIDGGDGTDTLLVTDDVGVSLNLTSISIEDATGGAGNDTFNASSATDRVVLDGAAGGDTLDSGSGDDSLTGGDGNDDIDGGAGLDVAFFSGIAADYQITGNATSATVIDQNAADGDEGTDTLANIERLVFSDATIHLDGTNSAPVAIDEVWKLRSIDTGNVLTADSLLANDGDPDSDHLQITGIMSVSNGAATIDSDGNIVFAAADGHTGDASFDYIVSDGHGSSNSATSIIDVFQALPDDDLFKFQWGLEWLNASAVWDDYTGSGIKIAVHDTGVDQDHTDIDPNYDETIDEDPGIGDHGTFVTGIVGAARNGDGIVGVAYDATLAVYTLPGLFDWSYAFNELDAFDVVNNSWTQSHDTLYDGSAGLLVSGKLEDLAETGRGGLGTISVFSGGNDRQDGDQSSYFDGQNSRHAVTVAAVQTDGAVADFSNPGASILVSAPGTNIVSTDVTGIGGFADSTYSLGGNYFAADGTSASAPFVSGVIALMLEANPNLGWRDVQEIVAYSGRDTDPTHQGWQTNGATNWNGGGLEVSHDFGFGFVDAFVAVRLAETWLGTAKSSNEVTATGSSAPTVAIPDEDSVSDTIAIASDVRIDHVEVTVDIDHTMRGDLVIELTSPDGTTSVLMDRPGKAPDDPDDRGSTGDDVTWRFYTTHHWGEGSQGDWTLTVRDLATGETGTLNNWSIDFYGDTPSSDDVYIYTPDFADFTTGFDVDRRSLSDASGHDTLNLASIFTNSIVDLRAGETSEIAGNTLTIAAGTTIEDLYLGDGHDVATGNDQANLIDGGRGNDFLTGGAGADDLRGGKGSDTADYSTSSLAVQVNLGAGTAAGGDAAGDTLTDIENITGSVFDDTLTGDNNDNALRGGDGVDDINGGQGADMLSGGTGNDDLSGDAGDDVLFGGLGDDSLTGGAGDDTAHYVGAFADYTVTDHGTHYTVSGLEGTDTLTDVEFVRFNDKRIYIGGSNTNPVAAAHSFTLSQGVPFILTQAALLVGATDADSDPLEISTVFRSENGTVTLASDNEVRFLVDPDFVGTTSFDYTITDGKAGGDTETVTLTVDPTQTLTGTSGDDIIVGLGSVDTINGGDGNDILQGGHGSDQLDGGTGTDTADYAESEESVSVDLALNSGTGGTAEGDTFANIENVTGGIGDDVLVGDSGVNVLSGAGGNDVLSGGDGADTLLGGDGDDTLRGGDGSDTLTGGFGTDIASYVDSSVGITLNLATGTHTGYAAGDSFHGIEAYEGSDLADTLTGSTAADALLGAGGNDTISGGDGNDSLDGGDGVDDIDGGSGDDTLSGGLGDDTLDGGNDDDTYLYTTGDGDDVILDSGFGAGSSLDDALRLHGIATADVTLTRSLTDDDDVTLGFAGGGSVMLNEQFGNTIFRMEKIEFDDGTIWLDEDIKQMLLDQSSTSGDDDILGFFRDDVLEGGLGNDTLDGGSGNDTYVYTAGDGDDVILDSGFGTGSSLDDTLRLHGIATADVTLTRSLTDDDDVTLSFAGGGSVMLNEQFGNTIFRMEKIEFDDGTVWTMADIEHMVIGLNPIVGTSAGETLNGTADPDSIQGLAGDDTLVGAGGSDIYLYSSGDGNDLIDDDAFAGTLDRLEFADLNVSDLIFSYKLSNTKDLLIMVNATGEVIDVDDQFRTGDYGIEVIEFADGTVWNEATILSNTVFFGTSGNDTINGTNSDDVIIGNGGDDTLDGNKGSDSFYYASGDGNDVIFEGQDSGTDRLVFSDLNVSDLTFSYKLSNTNDLLITVNATGDVIDADNQFLVVEYGLEEIEFADGTVWNEATILANISFIGTSGNDTINGTNSDDVIIGNGGDDTLDGNNGSDTYLYASGDGNDAIWESQDTSTDRLVFTDLNISDLTFSRKLSNTNDLLITVNTTGDVIDADNQFIIGGHGVEEIEFADGTIWDEATIVANAWYRGTAAAETINGTNGDNVIVGNGGDDTLSGAAGNDTYHYASGDGTDFLDDQSNDTSMDRLVFSDLNVWEVTARRAPGNSDDLEVAITATGEVITSDDQFYGGNWGLEEVEFADGTVWSRQDILDIADGTGVDPRLVQGTSGAETLTGTTGQDILIGYEGADTLEGGQGADAYVYNSGDGSDLINEWGDPADNDILHLGAGLLSTTVAVERGPSSIWDMVLDFGSGDQITAQGHFGDNMQFIEEVRFADGTTWSEEDLRLTYLSQHSTSGDDTVNGFFVDDVIDVGAGNDTVYAYDGNDTITGGTGNDVLEGLQGEDTYIFNFGDGADWIQEWSDPTAGPDAIEFGSGITTGMVSADRASDAFFDLVLTIGAGGDEIRVVNQFQDDWETIEEFRFNDSTVWTAEDVKANYLADQMTSGDDTINGFLGNDVIDGGAGEDGLFGSDGDDTLIGGADADYMEGGNGDDTFVFASGDGFDWIGGFEAGAASDDVIEIDGIAGYTQFSDVIAAATEINGDTHIDFDPSNGMALAGVSLASLHEDDFRFV